MMYKLLALDLDGTLINSQGLVDPPTIEAIKKAKEMGVKIVPCTGRGPGNLGTLYQDLDILGDDDFSILSNGALVISNKHNSAITTHTIGYDLAVEIFKFGISRNFCVRVYTTNKTYAYNCLQDEMDRIVHYGDSVIYMDTLDTECFKNEQILKVLFQKNDYVDFFKTLEPELKPITENIITISYSSNRYMEFNQHGIHKGIGLIDLAKYLNIDISETIGVGDNYNDKGLLEEAGLGIAVANAADEIKKIADVVTTTTNDENAIAEVINTYILDKQYAR